MCVCIRCLVKVSLHSVSMSVHVVSSPPTEGLAVGVGFGAVGKTPLASFSKAK